MLHPIFLSIHRHSLHIYVVYFNTWALGSGVNKSVIVAGFGEHSNTQVHKYTHDNTRLQNSQLTSLGFLIQFKIVPITGENEKRHTCDQGTTKTEWLSNYIQPLSPAV